MFGTQAAKEGLEKNRYLFSFVSAVPLCSANNCVASMNLSWISSAPVRIYSMSVLGKRAVCPVYGKPRLRGAATNQNSLMRRNPIFSVVYESQESSQQFNSEGIRVNKCFTSFASRRESDAFVREGRVMINGKLALPGSRVSPGNVVTLDGQTVDWERLTLMRTTRSFYYVKHWKRSDVLCTTDESYENNIVQEIKLPDVPDRLFPIGRLDESSTGLILLTSDGRLPNAVLGASQKCSKTYEVSTDRVVSEDDLVKLRKGIVITTEYRRGRSKGSKRVSQTLPCEVWRKRKDLLVTLYEGRNRQIRKMFGALGYTITMIHRIEFMGVTLEGLNGPGDSSLLSGEEMNFVKTALGEKAC
ncbi:unnamed protein product [Agarophyton chilense]